MQRPLSLIILLLAILPFGLSRQQDQQQTPTPTPTITPTPPPPDFTDAEDDFLVYAYNGQTMAQSLTNSSLSYRLGEAVFGAERVLPLTIADVYYLEQVPDLPPLTDGYGMYHGVWSPDRTQLALLALRDQEYRILLWANGSLRDLYQGTATRERGFVDPIGWWQGDLMLAERHMLAHLDTLRVWRLSVETGELTPFTNDGLAQPRNHRLTGRSAILPDGSGVLLGVELPNALAYSLDFASGDVRTHFISMVLPERPPSVFELAALHVIGVLPAEQIAPYTDRLNSSDGSLPYVLQQPEPFLYWSLPDDKRRTTCFPDSDFTRTRFNVTCPILGIMYEGHQGTDTGGQDGGLTRGTDVYAATPGWVVGSFTGCDEGNPSCGRAYGNTVTMEHHLVVRGHVQVWHTGYAHLRAVNVAPYTYIADISQPIAESGATGVGGAHLHVEVRRPQVGTLNWVDPWDDRVTGRNLWVGSNVEPTSAMTFDSTQIGR